MARFFREVRFVADELIGTLPMGAGVDGPVETAWMHVRSRRIDDAEHVRRAVWVSSDVYGKIDMLGGLDSDNPSVEQITAQRRIVVLRGDGGHVRLTFMTFDAEGLQSPHAADRPLWSGFWLPGAARLASMLQDLAAWASSAPDNVDAAELRTVLLASRRAAHTFIGVMPTPDNWEAEGLAGVHGERPHPDLVSNDVIGLEWGYIEAASFRVETVWRSWLRRHCQNRATFVPYPHIDNAWFMPEALTPHLVEGAAGSLRRAHEHGAPSAHFGPAMYWASLLRQNPSEFAALRGTVAGQPALLASTWAEPDFTLLTGDSIVDQLRLAQTFNAQHWPGVSATSGWFPDSPGFPSALVQLLADAGVTYFFTARLRFNPPHLRTPSRFVWAGSGGARVFAEVAYTDQGYLGSISASALERGSIGFDEPYGSGPVYAFGYSGGGVATADEWVVLDHLTRNGIEQVPLGDRSMARSEDGSGRDPIREISGALPLHTHRGMVSVDASGKELFRASEDKISAFKLSLALFPQIPVEMTEALHACQIRLAELQSHDTIDGTVPRGVSTFTHQALNELGEQLDGHIRSVLNRTREKSEHRELDLVNLATVAVRPQLESWPEPTRQRATTGGHLFAASEPVDPASVLSAERDESQSVRVEAVAGGFRFVNEFVTIELLRDGSATVFDLIGEQRGQFGTPRLSLDVPSWYDGWELDPHHHLTDAACIADGMRVTEEGPIRATVEVHYRLPGGGRLSQQMALWSNSPRLDVSFKAHGIPSRAAVRWPLRHIGRMTAADAPYAVENVPLPSVEQDQNEERIASSWVGRTDDHLGLIIAGAGPFGFRCAGSMIGIGLFRAPLFPNPGSGSAERRFSVSLTDATLPDQLDRAASECREQMTGSFYVTNRAGELQPNRFEAIRSMARVLSVSDVGAGAGGLIGTVVNLTAQDVNVRSLLAEPERLRRIGVVSQAPVSKGDVLVPGEIARFAV